MIESFLSVSSAHVAFEFIKVVVVCGLFSLGLHRQWAAIICKRHKSKYCFNKGSALLNPFIAWPVLCDILYTFT